MIHPTTVSFTIEVNDQTGQIVITPQIEVGEPYIDLDTDVEPVKNPLVRSKVDGAELLMKALNLQVETPDISEEKVEEWLAEKIAKVDAKARRNRRRRTPARI